MSFNLGMPLPGLGLERQEKFAKVWMNQPYITDAKGAKFGMNAEAHETRRFPAGFMVSEFIRNHAAEVEATS